MEKRGVIMEKTIEQLKQEIATAATTGNDNAFNSLIKEYNSRKAEVAKALQVKALEEANALAGARETEAVLIFKDIKKLVPNIYHRLEAVKAAGFTFKVDYSDASGVVTHLKSVALAVPTIKAVRTGTRKSSPTGNPLEADFQAYATQENRDKIAAIEADLANGAIDARTANSRKWVVKNTVRKAAITAGKLQPIS